MGRITDEFGIPKNDYSFKKDLITGTPVNKKIPFNLAVIFEWVKLIQRVIMVGLTAVLICVMLQANVEMKGMKIEMQKMIVIAEDTRVDIMKQIEEFQRDGIDFNIKLW